LFAPTLEETNWDPAVLDPIRESQALSSKAAVFAATMLPVQSNSLYMGFLLTVRHQIGGHAAYLLGKQSNQGWWYYFPVAFAVKTPVGTLLGCGIVLTAAILAWSRRRRIEDAALWLCATVPCFVYWGFCLTSHVDIGLRHLLPIYPFLCVLLGLGLSALTVPWLAWVLLAMTAAETAGRFPYYTAFFNVLAGGPAAGPRYLLDSNLDWGQDLKRVRRFMQDHHIEKIRLQYFGSFEPSDIGLRYDGVPLTSDARGRAGLDEYVAISATLLNGQYVDPQWFAWLRPLTPVERIGYSIYVYDLRKHPGND
jgi:hypothetical protein